ncbi:hypothetical protein PQE75_gp001 [Bacillus phage vB_BcoS-136]|uniref:Uncharacterized protein n=1 Tax=Bacillus phage vB_BcoS-136 TaxID=2419619 RepID=A0A3G3BV82_9CAUD|nr:hypothetical protein PQE75_gp001 [Bacillus phage vB_BcoS-136]AYP68133.1 hypothetical protein vBBcoS136_00001 [Bacillus phage vB_BcoS-136]
MNYVVKIAENDKAVLKIIQDNDALNPRKEYDNFGTMICFHNRYDLGDESSYRDPRDFLEDLAFDLDESLEQDVIEEMENEALLDVISRFAVILPLYLYDHSGITMNTTGFSCHWDSGQVGWTYATHGEIINEYGSLELDKAEALLKSEVETYDQYLTGEVYGFVLEEKVKCDCCENVERNEIESFWGFFGLDCIVEEVGSHIGEEYKDLVEKLEWVS